jgi:iron complex outermembrane receptor protein
VLAQPSGSLEEVVVTARKRIENVQDVPISMSIRDGGLLANSNSLRIQEILRSMPNVSNEIQQPRQASISIRGLGKNPGNEGLEASVGIFLDGVYLGRSGMAVTDLIDAERMEVLRGPQGTLFGKNTTAGALAIVTRAPGREFEAWGQISMGSEDLAQFSGALNVPIADRLAFRLSAFDTERRGTVINDVRGERLGEHDRRGARAQVSWTPTDAIGVRFIADYNSQDEDGPGYLLIDPGIVMADGSVRPNNFLDRSARAGYTPVFDAFARRADAESAQNVSTEQAGFSTQVDVRFDKHAFTSITAWRKWSFVPEVDGDFTALSILPVTGVTVRDRQFSQEFRLASATDAVFHYMLGVYLFAQDIESNSEFTYGVHASDFMTRGLTPLALDGFGVNIRADPKTDSAAAFAQGAWRPTSDWELTAGARWTTEKREGGITRNSSGGAPLPAGSTAAMAARERIGGFVSVQMETAEDFVSGLLSARYTISETMMTYLSLSRGAKSGGLNIAIVPAGVSPVLDPETANAAEIGWKSEWLNRTLQMNLAAFWMEVNDYQAAQRDRARNTSYLTNAGSVRSRGIELESLYRPSPSLELGLSAGWNDATYTSFTAAPCPTETVNPTVCDVTGQRVAGSPPWTATGTARYEIPIGANGLRVFTDAEYTHTATYKLDLSNYTRVNAYGIANLQVGLRGRDDRWRVWAWARNLLDEEYYSTMVTAGAFSSGAVVGLVGDARAYGLSLRGRF